MDFDDYKKCLTRVFRQSAILRIPITERVPFQGAAPLARVQIQRGQIRVLYAGRRRHPGPYCKAHGHAPPQAAQSQA